MMSEDIILVKFDEWTRGLGAEEARIAIFEHVRDIPYAIIPELRDPLQGPAGILRLNKGSCQPKHYLLALLFARLGIPIKYVTYKFKWGDSPIKYPQELKELALRLPFGYHLASKAYINNKWILVDATWDLPLKKVNFPVNERWDGISDTTNAVIAKEEIVHETAQERVSYEAQKRSLYSEEEKSVSGEFIEKLNMWLDETRQIYKFIILP